MNTKKSNLFSLPVKLQLYCTYWNLMQTLKPVNSTETLLPEKVKTTKTYAISRNYRTDLLLSKTSCTYQSKLTSTCCTGEG